MTSFAAVPAASTGPVPWPRLGWPVWRRYRATFAATIGFLGLIAVYVVIAGHQMRSAYRAYLACSPANSAKCQYLWATFRDGYGASGLLVTVLVLLPGVVGVFAGAPVLARELEAGTFRYAWTQGVGRMRWAIAALVPGAAGVAVISMAFGVLVSWYNQPLLDTGITPRLRATIFPITGPAAGGWALLGFALGVLAGLLWRRVLPALVTSFAAWFGLALLVASVLRMNYLPRLTTTSLQLSQRDLSLGQWWAKDGVRVSDADIGSILQAIGVQTNGGTRQQVGGDAVDPSQYLLQHGYDQVTSYQPDGRYWTFQWIEFGWLIALAAILLGVTLWLLRRRAG